MLLYKHENLLTHSFVYAPKHTLNKHAELNIKSTDTINIITLLMINHKLYHNL